MVSIFLLRVMIDEPRRDFGAEITVIIGEKSSEGSDETDDTPLVCILA